MKDSAAPGLSILFLDNHLVAVDKPAGLLTQSDVRGAPNLLDQTRDWIKNEYGKPGKVYLGLVHRLDRPVSGVVLFARTSKAASRLSEQFRNHTAQKFYLALVEGVPEKETGRLVHYLRKEKSLKTTVFPRPAPEAKQAELTYTVLENKGETSLVEVELHTGRFHQIRAQLGFIGHPLVGDVKYRAQSTLPEGRIALHANKLIVTHPTTGEPLTLESPAPEDWPS
ncbi:RluA family pseudouridine synthase [Nitrospina watsonii]|uniref:Pseudouridine synthase n=1 Tax=Nitrospina watsonii TaxID=1323948 RepID=A0ABM9HBD1_9BACT|nr:RluA family pseudouridine synthase [Nitrospina watsonii]CAI2717500.1 Pseudouridine synthase [Nitrospina watsonii]